ncbi:acyl-CoA dehydrogenase family protein [Dactylosporangium sp. NPDC051485]|uniref:acyl-CoA dehydrogenase family protein n=1 Tax=Dactylosporangium sp. NPDC051485 TaxID=3154846 RepID=UPI003449BA78
MSHRAGAAEHAEATAEWAHLDAESRQIASRAREHLARHLAPIVADCERDRRFPYELLGGLLDLGFVRGVCGPQDGGYGRTHLQNALLMEEAGRVWASLRTTMNILSLVAELLASSGTPQQKASYLAPLLRGERRGWFAITEAEAGSDAAGLTTRAERLPDGSFRLTGEKRYITNAAQGDFGIVMASTDPALGAKGITAFIVEHDRGGVTVSEQRRLSVRGTSSCTVTLDGAVVPKDLVLGQVGRGLATAMAAVNAGRVNVAAGATGLGQACLEAAVAHTTARQQFGKAIAGFQLVQEMVVGIGVRTHAGRLLYQDAARALDAGRDARTACAMAKLYCTEAAVRSASDTIQLHGAAGLEEGTAPERYFRDAREATIPEGTSQMQILTIGRALLGVSAIR